MCLPFDYDMDVISSVMNPSNSIFSAWSIYCFFFFGARGRGRGAYYRWMESGTLFFLFLHHIQGIRRLDGGR